MFKQYQKEATMTFKNHQELTPEEARLLDWATGLGGETGEVLELIKHQVFSKEPIDKMDLAKELGDVLWYLTALAESSGIQMQDIAELNLAKLSHRYNAGEYTNKESQDRHKRERIFTDTPIYKRIQARIEQTPAPINVIFIGPDGGGKTTIAKRLAEELDMKYHKCTFEEEDKPERARYLLNSQTNIVYDRFYYPDDIVYSEVKGIARTEDYRSAINSLVPELKKSNVLFIYVNCALEELKERSAVWADDYITIDQLEKIQQEYDKILQIMQFNEIATVCIDTTGVEVDSPRFKTIIDNCFYLVKRKQLEFIQEEDE